MDASQIRAMLAQRFNVDTSAALKQITAARRVDSPSTRMAVALNRLPHVYAGTVASDGWLCTYLIPAEES